MLYFKNKDRPENSPIIELMKTFRDLDLPEMLHNSLEVMEYETPTPIQAKAIPVALEGKDVLGSAQTGTGKTAAFAIPILRHMAERPGDGAIILTPTRELSMQVMSVVKQLIGKNKDIKTSALIGGTSMFKQIKELERGTRLVVGTPGRVNDHLLRKTLSLKNTKFVVLDEADRMLDMGFGIQIDAILKHIPKDKQTLMFSATLPKGIIRLTEKYMDEPVRIAVAADNQAAAKIKQEFIELPEAEKYTALVGQLNERRGSIIVFVKTKRSASQLSLKLNKKKFKSRAIHGDLKQGQRDRVIKAFRNQTYEIMVATDVAARGLDIPHIEHVINYDLPQCPEDYIHRIGRTGRAGAEGASLCLISPQDRSKLYAIKRLMNPDIKDDNKNRSCTPIRKRSGRGIRFARGRSRGGLGGGSHSGRCRGRGERSSGDKDSVSPSPFGGFSKKASGKRKRKPDFSFDFGNEGQDNNRKQKEYRPGDFKLKKKVKNKMRSVKRFTSKKSKSTA